MVVGASVVVVVSAMFGKVRVQILTLCSFIGTLPLSSLALKLKPPSKIYKLSC